MHISIMSVRELSCAHKIVFLCAQVIISCQQKKIYIYHFSGLQGLRTEFFSVLIVIQRKRACVGMQHAQHETIQRSGAHFRREIQQTLSRTLDSELTFAEMENSKFLVWARLIWVGSINSESCTTSMKRFRINVTPIPAIHHGCTGEKDICPTSYACLEWVSTSFWKRQRQKREN